MATMAGGWCTTLLPRPGNVTGEGLVWSLWGGSFGNETGATHNGERVWTVNPSYKAFTASTAVMAGAELRGLVGFAGDCRLFSFEQAAGVEILSLKFDPSGHLAIYIGGTFHARTTGTPPISSAATYYTAEVAMLNTAGAGAAVVETRLNGQRVLELTTANAPAGAGLSTGTMAAVTTAAGGAVIDKVRISKAGEFLSPGPVYWYYQKFGSVIWTPVTSGATWALQTDFVGQKKRAWLTPTAVGNYTMSGAGSGTQNSNWANGAGSYPSSIADAAGMDSDTTYIKNAVSGTGVSADKISHKYTLLPDTATTIGFVQRTIIVRSESAASDTIRSGNRSPSGATPANTDTMDPDIIVGPGYGIGTNSAGTVYYPRTPWDATLPWSAAFIGTTTVATNRFEGIDEQRALS